MLRPSGSSCRTVTWARRRRKIAGATWNVAPFAQSSSTFVPERSSVPKRSAIAARYSLSVPRTRSMRPTRVGGSGGASRRSSIASSVASVSL